MADFLRPSEAFACVDAQGVRRRFDPSMVVDVKHWAVKGREHLFEPVRDVDEAARSQATSFGPRGVEQATAAPGEKRSVRRPRRSGDEAGDSSDA